MLAKLYSAAVVGLEARPIEVEVDLSVGLHTFQIVGLADKVVSESKERVSSAIKNTGFSPPQHSRRRVIVNLAPAELKKEGPAYDLPIALAFLFAFGQINIELPDEKLFIGELSLEGKIRPVKGVLSIALMAKKEHFRYLFVPQENAAEAALVKGLKVIPVNSLSQLIDYFKKKEGITPAPSLDISQCYQNQTFSSFSDMAYIKGQEQAKRALEIAAAGRHNLLMTGPPGSGKTLLARTLPSILPPLSLHEALEVTKIFSVAGCLALDSPLITQPPFRAPHHTASAIALVGGGSHPRPGEITLAHRGVLFLDEFPEFSRSFLESLRQPLEDGSITVSRAQASVTFPAKFILIGAMNPCPCGNLGSLRQPCTCSATQISRYQKKVSAPLRDRIDLHIEVPKVSYEKLSSKKMAESSSAIKQRVEKAQEIQRKRFFQEKERINNNSEMGLTKNKKYCQIDSKGEALIRAAMSQLHLSARSYHRLLKLARTIADLEEEEKIHPHHLSEAIQYQPRQEDF